MAGRYSGPVRFFYRGDESVARQYNGIARKLVAYLQNQSELVRDNLWTASRRVKISDGVIIEVLKVTDLIYNAYIDVRDVTPKPVTDAFIYQFAYTGDGDQLWDIDYADIGGISSPWAGGIFLATIFVFRENTTDYGVFPILSTRSEIRDDTKWDYIPNLGDIPYADLVAKFPIPRHEILLASSEHLRFPDKRKMAHASWMPKGARHYMASALSTAAIRELGGYGQLLAGDAQLSLQATSNGGKATDVGYEASLDLYEPPLFELEKLVKGQARRSAPDSDWYSSYGYQKVEDSNWGTREFGIMVDASQQVWVWPLEAAKAPYAVSSHDPPYNTWAGHSIKVNVNPVYSFNQILVFPNDVAGSPGDQFRVAAGTAFENLPDGPFHGSPFDPLVRYIWHPSPDGKKFATIVERGASVQKPHLFRNGQPMEALELDELICQVVADASVPQYALRFERPVPAQFEVAITLTGPEFEDFTVIVTPVEVIEVSDNFFPVQARFAADVSYEGVSRGELLVGGFELYTVAPLSDMPSSDLVQHIENEGELGSLYGSRNIKFLTALAFQSTTPALESFSYKLIAYASGGPPTERRCRYSLGKQYRYGDLSYSKLDQSWDGTFSDSVAEMIQELQWNFTMEGAFTVQKANGEGVFRKTIRKYVDSPLKMGNWFTAQVANLDISTGSVVFGLCESTTYYTGVDNDIPYEQVGMSGGFEPQPVYLPDTSEQLGVNSSKKGYACYWKGELVSSNTQAGLSVSRLDEALSSYPMDLNTRFWGSVYSGPAFLISPGTNLIKAPYMYNTELASQIGAENSTVSGLASALNSGYVGIPDFPWGLDMGAWFFNNHFDQNNADKILADDTFFSFFGRYVTLDGPLVTVGKDNSIHEPIPSVSDEVIDIIAVRELTLTHTQLINEAFGISVDPARKLTLRTEDTPYSYERRFTLGTDVIFEETVPVHSMKASVEVNGISDFYQIDLENPTFRVYCNINSYPFFYMNGDGHTSETAEERFTYVWSNIQSRAYGYTVLNEEEDDGN